MKKALILMIVLMISAGAYAQIEAPVKWSYAAKKLPNNQAVILLRATIQDGWHIYSLNVGDGGPIKTSFKFEPSKEYSLVGKTTEPKPSSKYEDAFRMNVTFFEKSVTFQQKIKLKSGKLSAVKGQLEYMTCNDKKCLPPANVDFTVALSK